MKFKLWSISIAFALTSCVLGPGGSLSGNDGGAREDMENPAPPVSALDDPTHPGLGACRGTRPASDVEAALSIAHAFESSCHEMVICGGLANSFSLTFVQILISAVSGSSSRPSGFVYRNNGHYDAAERMDVTLHLGRDTSFGRVGDLITFDVFDLGNYFSGLSVSASASVDLRGQTRTSYGLRFSGALQGAELLALLSQTSS